MISWSNHDEKTAELRAFCLRATALDQPDPDESGEAKEPTPEACYVRFYRGKTRRSRENCSANIDYKTGDSPTELRKRVEAVVRGLSIEARETVWIEALHAKDTGPFASFSGVVEVDEQTDDDGQIGGGGTIAEALRESIRANVTTIRVLRSQNDELVGSLLSAARNVVDIAGEVGYMRAQLQIGSDQADSDRIASVIEAVGPLAAQAIMAAMANPGGKAHETPPPVVEGMPPRPAGGPERVQWDVDAIERHAQSIMRAWSARPEDVPDSVIEKLSAFSAQAAQAVEIMRATAAARTAGTPSEK